MDAVCGQDNWDVLMVESDGEIIASLPYYIKDGILIHNSTIINTVKWNMDKIS